MFLPLDSFVVKGEYAEEGALEQPVVVKLQRVLVGGMAKIQKLQWLRISDPTAFELLCPGGQVEVQEIPLTNSEV